MKILIFVSLLIYIATYKLKRNKIQTSDYVELNSFRKQLKVFTQGLIYSNGVLFESGGLTGQSRLVRVNYPPTDNSLFYKQLQSDYFAEGIAICGNYIYQLTWQNKKILKYLNDNQLTLAGEVDMDAVLSQGWGLASYNNILYATNGSNNIYTSPCTETPSFKKEYSIQVDNIDVDKLNAIAVVDGVIYANRWFTNLIYKIKDGQVVKIYDLNLIVNKEGEMHSLGSDDVLNGIAHLRDNIYIFTGKNWDNYYEIELH
jgi:glutamine cyclotransferase